VEARPFLLFDGDCAEAMEFYHTCLGGELTLTKLMDTPMKVDFRANKHSSIIYSQLISGGVEISAADWMADDFAPLRGNMSAIHLSGEDFAELEPVFDKLRDGQNNSRLQELHEMPFGIYGQLYDRYGVQWIFRGGHTQ
jgi:PhnB protein